MLVANHLQRVVIGDDPPRSAEAQGAGDGKVTQDERELWQMNIAEWKEWGEDEPADNSFCNVCHANLQDERLVKTHLPVGVGCETCHGISDKHSEDEDSLIPPDVLFAQGKIAHFCVQCHAQDELVESQDEHEELFAAMKQPPQQAQASSSEKEASKTCTECHRFKHVIKNRTRRWNKDTGKLEWYDGVRMMQERDG
jgi:hypothetical protein